MPRVSFLWCLRVVSLPFLTLFLFYWYFALCIDTARVPCCVFFYGYKRPAVLCFPGGSLAVLFPLFSRFIFTKLTLLATNLESVVVSHPFDILFSFVRLSLLDLSYTVNVLFLILLHLTVKKSLDFLLGSMDLL